MCADAFPAILENWVACGSTAQTCRDGYGLACKLLGLALKHVSHRSSGTSAPSYSHATHGSNIIHCAGWYPFGKRRLWPFPTKNFLSCEKIVKKSQLWPWPMSEGRDDGKISGKHGWSGSKRARYFRLEKHGNCIPFLCLSNLGKRNSSKENAFLCE